MVKALHEATLYRVLLVAVLLLSACATSDDGAEGTDELADGVEADDAPATEIRLGLVLPDLSNPFINPISVGAQEAADELGIELLVTGSNDPTEQVSAMQNYIAAGVDAIGFNSIDADALGSIVEEANDAGIPVLAVVSGTNVGDLETFISADFEEAGRLVGNQVGEQWCQGKDPCRVAVVQGALADEAGLDGDTGFKDGILAYENVEIVAEAPTNYDASEAFNAAQNMLTANPDLDFIHAWWSSGSLSVLEAVRDAGLLEQVGVSSLTGACTVLEELIEGNIYADAMMFPQLMGRAYVEEANRLLTENASLDETTNTPVYLMTTEEANAILADESQAPAELPEVNDHLQRAESGSC